MRSSESNRHTAIKSSLLWPLPGTGHTATASNSHTCSGLLSHPSIHPAFYLCNGNFLLHSLPFLHPKQLQYITHAGISLAFFLSLFPPSKWSEWKHYSYHLFTIFTQNNDCLLLLLWKDLKYLDTFQISPRGTQYSHSSEEVRCCWANDKQDWSGDAKLCSTAEALATVSLASVWMQPGFHP